LGGKEWQKEPQVNKPEQYNQFESLKESQKLYFTSAVGLDWVKMIGKIIIK
jgi:hypothetical protein